MNTVLLKGKAALVTGSTSGIGLGLARGLAAAGADVMLNGFGEAAEVEALRQEIAREYKVKCLYDAADMRQPAAIAAMVQRAKAEFGRLDILVNNAGIQHVAPIDEFPEDKWDAIIAINLSSAFHASKAAIPLMKEQGWGRIVNIASAHALVASPFKSAYVAAKHGIAGFTKAAALELAQSKITVNAICPGYVKTPLVENQIGATAKARNMTEEQVVRDVILAAQPTREFTKVEDLAALTLLLCSDAGANINGAMLSVDGGWTAQ